MSWGWDFAGINNHGTNRDISVISSALYALPYVLVAAFSIRDGDSFTFSLFLFLKYSGLNHHLFSVLCSVTLYRCFAEKYE